VQHLEEDRWDGGSPASGRTLTRAACAAGALAAKAPATPDADEARQAANKELSRPIYRDSPDLWDRFWEWIKEHFNTGNMVPGVPSWVSTAIVIVVAVFNLWGDALRDYLDPRKAN